MDTDPTPESPHSRLRRDLRDRAAWTLSVAVIVWSDDPEAQPTIIADRSPVVVARAAALAIHEMITDPDVYAGATDFLETQKPPQDWRTPEDVDAWLEALQQSTPYPAFSFHRVPVTGGTDGLNGLMIDQHLQHVVQQRERAVLSDDPGHQLSSASCPPRLER